ncbi:MAG TPA: xanthine dehydrogenase family protein molybdopterin-binding subunit [Stellaceae bacterium]|nr:xanthine dehydrogenase family protein molybdopterin-binding subunit [Stellaceae bacterium]
MSAPADRGRYLGRPVRRLEDAALLRGEGRFADDLPVRPGTLYAAILRAPHAHAEIAGIDTTAALALPGCECVVTGEDAKRWTRPFAVAVKTAMEHYCLAIDRVRYVGEPVAVALARDRHTAEDAIERISVDYRPLPAILDPEAAAMPDAPLLHPAVGSNVISDRAFRYGDPEAAFVAAAHRISITSRYPRNTACPLECFVVTAEYLPGEEAYEITANFQGPFAMHPVMAMALGIPGNRLRFRTPPNSGGSFGAKHAIFPYIVLLALATRRTGRPVKWVETRLEHLTAATAATGRITTLSAAVDRDGVVSALDWDQLEDCGAYLRAPEPATLYRMHGNMTGAYGVRHLKIRNRVVLTSKTPSGLVRGFGGPQVYFALERLMQRIAQALGLDPLEVIRRNLVASFPHRCPAGAVLDSGDYHAAIDDAAERGGLAELAQEREKARAAGRLYGIGFAAVVEPAISNMGYITTVLTPDERERAGPKGGARAAATIALDPLGGVSVMLDSAPQGQGHRTVAAQLVADAFGLKPAQISVEPALETATSAWSIAAGNYSSRFAGATAGALHLAALRLRGRLAAIAAAQLNRRPEELVFADGHIFAADNPENSLSFARVAAAGHWSGETAPELTALRETVFWSPAELAPPNAADEVNSSAVYGFVFDFCGVEIDRDTGAVRIDRYVSLHDAGHILNPALFDGQVKGGFAMALGAALHERCVYDEGGAMLTGSLLDYPMATAAMIPALAILHRETPSPVTPLGAKGVAEGNAMSTPVCIANAVADALGVGDVALPLTPERVLQMLKAPLA